MANIDIELCTLVPGTCESTSATKYEMGSTFIFNDTEINMVLFNDNWVWGKIPVVDNHFYYNEDAPYDYASHTYEYHISKDYNIPEQYYKQYSEIVWENWHLCIKNLTPNDAFKRGHFAAGDSFTIYPYKIFNSEDYDNTGTYIYVLVFTKDDLVNISPTVSCELDDSPNSVLRPYGTAGFMADYAPYRLEFYLPENDSPETDGIVRIFDGDKNNRGVKVYTGIDFTQGISVNFS